MTDVPMKAYMAVVVFTRLDELGQGETHFSYAAVVATTRDDAMDAVEGAAFVGDHILEDDGWKVQWKSAEEITRPWLVQALEVMGPTVQ